MILKFDNPISIEDARQLYNNNVKFITDTDHYPNIVGVEFNSDPRIIFKRKIVAPRVTKKSNKILYKYESEIKSIWSDVFSKIRSSAKNIKKDESFKLSENQRKQLLSQVDEFKDKMSLEAQNKFTESYKLGKLRGQAITGQELDDDLDLEDEELINERLDENLEYLTIFTGDIKDSLDQVLSEGPYESFDELDELIQTRVEEPKKSRATMYAMAALGLVAAGMVYSMRRAKREDGELEIRGGYWTIHPDEGNGGEVCEGCLENSGKWFTIDEFEQEYQANNCLTRCRCDLDTI